jgi:hypothetical protein
MAGRKKWSQIRAKAAPETLEAAVRKSCPSTFRPLSSYSEFANNEPTPTWHTGR